MSSANQRLRWRLLVILIAVGMVLAVYLLPRRGASCDEATVTGTHSVPAGSEDPAARSPDAGETDLRVALDDG